MKPIRLIQFMILFLGLLKAFGLFVGVPTEAPEKAHTLSNRMQVSHMVSATKAYHAGEGNYTLHYHTGNMMNSPLETFPELIYTPE